MTSVVCTRLLGAVHVPGASPGCSQKLRLPTCTTSALHVSHKTLAQRDPGGYRTSFLGAGGDRLLSPLTCRERAGSAKFQVVALKRGGGPRRRTREANPMEQAAKGPKMNEAVL